MINNKLQHRASGMDPDYVIKCRMNNHTRDLTGIWTLKPCIKNFHPVTDELGYLYMCLL